MHVYIEFIYSDLLCVILFPLKRLMVIVIARTRNIDMYTYFTIFFFQYSSEGEEEEDVLADPNNIGYKTKPKKVLHFAW